jgi:hypothetical protein
MPAPGASGGGSVLAAVHKYIKRKNWKMEGEKRTSSSRRRQVLFSQRIISTSLA